MNRPTSLEERIQIGIMAEMGMSDKAIAQRIGWSVHTVRKWRRKYEREGRQGMASPMGRRKQGALSTFPAPLRARRKSWRDAHPGWGPKTLYAELQAVSLAERHVLPSVASIGRFLHEQHLTRAYEKHNTLPVPRRDPAARPHAAWEMDARGYSRVPDVGLVSLIQLNDRCSHARLLSYPVWVGNQRCMRHPTTEDYQTALRLAFSEWGLPQQVQVDHESMFFDNTSKSPFPTRLHLWLLALGVELVFGRPRRPTDQGMTERSHQLWAAQCLTGQHYPNWHALYQALQQRRDFLNYQLPCASLSQQPPLVAWSQATHSGRAYRPEWEGDLIILDRVWAFLAQGWWFRKVSVAYTFQLGGSVYYVGTPWQHTQLEITFDPTESQLVCSNEAGRLVARCPIQGITAQSLMGDLAAYLHWPSFQLALPFEWADCQAVRLFETIPVRLNEL